MQANGGYDTDVEKHCAAMRTGYYAFYGIWSSKKISFPIKKLFFTALVTSAGLSGLEPLALSAVQHAKLERFTTGTKKQLRITCVYETSHE